MREPDNLLPRENLQEKPAASAGELAPEDYYIEGQYVVFTAAYHVKRGSCCNSGCRHCPWRHGAD